MLNAIIAASLRHRAVVLGAAALLLAVGGWAALRMPVDVLPDLTAPTVTVLAEAHGMAPEEVEALVTIPIESAMNGAAGIRRVRSSTALGIAVVWVEFDWDVDLYRARQMVTERLQSVAAALPDGLPPPVLAPVSSVMGEIMMIGLTGPQSPMELRTVADWVIRRRLLAVAGVAQVVPIGGERREYQVLPDPSRMRAAAVGLEDIVSAARDANAPATGGVFQRLGQEYPVRVMGRLTDPGELAGSVVAERAGVPITLGDVAQVRIGSAPRFGAGSVNGRPGVVLAVQKQPAANTLELSGRVDQVLAEIQATLPVGMTIETKLFRQADFIAVAVRNVVTALRDGAVLVTIVLVLFLGNLPATAISLVAIPLSLAVAVLGLQAIGTTINTMTLGGMAIAVGVLVDDAIIDVENVFRRLRENAALPETERRSVLAVVYRASKEVRSAILYATLVIVVVFGPLFFLGGIEGRLLQPLGLSYVVAMLASLVVAVTVTPVLCSLLLPRVATAAGGGESRVVGWLQARYRRSLEAALTHPRTVLLGTGLTLLASLTTVPLLGTAFLPEFNEGSLTVSVVTLPGTGLEESDRIGARVEEILLAHPAVSSTDRRQGRAELDEHAQGVNAAEIDVALVAGADRVAAQADLRRRFTGIPGTNVTIGQPIGHRIDHLLSGTRASIAVKVYGPDLARLRQIGESVRDAMAPVEGVVDLQIDQQIEVPQLRIEPDRGALGRQGLTVGDLSRAVDVLLGGETVSEVLEGGRTVPIVVRLPDSVRADPVAIEGLLLDAPGGTVTLGQVATVRVDRGPAAISREQVQRKLVVQANIQERDLGSVVGEIQAGVGRSVSLPDGYHIEYGGQFEAQRESLRRLTALSVVAILAVGLILYTEFRSVRLVTLIMANLPLALVGGLAAVWASGGVVSVASLIGFVTLFGIATRNGLLLVTRYRQLNRQGVPVDEAVRRGSHERLAPILMTALTAGLALVPLALGGGKPGNELQTPMAAVILGGLLSATALNMIVVPVLYLWVESRSPRPTVRS
ncbi:MAG: efflux RND transporter permease subunit [Gemmatimonadales bacterium]